MSNDNTDERVIRAELKATAVKAGMVDLDGLKLADLSKVTLNDHGEVEGAESLMEDMKKAKPWLFGSGSSTSNTDPKPKPAVPADRGVRDLDRADYEKAKRAAIRGR